MTCKAHPAITKATALAMLDAKRAGQTLRQIADAHRVSVYRVHHVIRAQLGEGEQMPKADEIRTHRNSRQPTISALWNACHGPIPDDFGDTYHLPAESALQLFCYAAHTCSGHKLDVVALRAGLPPCQVVRMIDRWRSRYNHNDGEGNGIARVVTRIARGMTWRSVNRTLQWSNPNE